MNFPISGVHVSPIGLILVGFVVGILGGFFGVGGSFIAGPALFGFGLPMNFVVGTDLAHLVGKSVVAARKHNRLGNIDFKLGAIMMIGTLPAVEAGAQLIEYLKKTSHIEIVVGVVFIIALTAISGFMAWERWSTHQMNKGRRKPKSSSKGDERSAFSGIAKRIQHIDLGPHIRLPASGIERISVWSILAVSIVGGFFSGFLGGGAGYIRMPSMIYLLGIPTHTAIGTDLFEIIVSAGYGTVSHALKGNVDVLIALVMHTGAAMGAQIGALATQYFSGVNIRLAFIPVPLIGAAIVLHGLITGHPPK